MNVVVSGGTGAIGRHLLAELSRRGHSVAALTRTPAAPRPWLPSNVRPVGWDARGPGAWEAELEGAGCVIHLAGEGIFGGRWSEDFKRKILDSRVRTTRLLAETIAACRERPGVFVSVSAVGYYGETGDSTAVEGDAPGDDFLAGVCVAWEEAAAVARGAGVRVAHPRLGVVLQADGGALARMLPAFRFFAGGYFGDGSQWFPWVHVDDVVSGLLAPIEITDLEGPFNLVSPGEISMGDFCRSLAAILGRPCWRIPAAPVRLALGEAASTLLGSQRVAPRRLTDAGFVFRYADAGDALRAILE